MTDQLTSATAPIPSMCARATCCSSRSMQRPSTESVPLDRGRVVLAYGEVTGHAHAIRSGSATLVQPTPGVDICGRPRP